MLEGWGIDVECLRLSKIGTVGLGERCLVV